MKKTYCDRCKREMKGWVNLHMGVSSSNLGASSSTLWELCPDCSDIVRSFINDGYSLGQKGKAIK